MDAVGVHVGQPLHRVSVTRPPERGVDLDTAVALDLFGRQMLLLAPAPVHLDVRAAPELGFDRGDRRVVGVVVLRMQERLDLVLRHIDVVVGRDQPAGCSNHHPP